MYVDRIPKYSKAVADRCASQVQYDKKVYADGRIEGTYSHVQIDPYQSRVIGFINDTGIPTCRPGVSMRARGATDQDNQRAFYSGFMKCHRLKAQTAKVVDGMFASVWVASIRNNNNRMFNLSNLGDYLIDILPLMPNPADPNMNMRYAFYGDKIFQNHECIITRPKGQLDNPSDVAIFDRFDSMRASIEMMYGGFKNIFPIFGGKKRLRLMNQGAEIVWLVLFGFFP